MLYFKVLKKMLYKKFFILFISIKYTHTKFDTIISNIFYFKYVEIKLIFILIFHFFLFFILILIFIFKRILFHLFHYINLVNFKIVSNNFIIRMCSKFWSFYCNFVLQYCIEYIVISYWLYTLIIYLWKI